MGAMASQITGVTIVYSTVCSGADRRKLQSSTSLAFVRVIHWWPVNSPHKGPVIIMFPFDAVIMDRMYLLHCLHAILRTDYRQASNISRIKSKNVNVHRLVLQLSLTNPLKPKVLSREWRCSWSSAEWPTIVLPSNVRLRGLNAVSFIRCSFSYCNYRTRQWRVAIFHILLKGVVVKWYRRCDIRCYFIYTINLNCTNSFWGYFRIEHEVSQ